MKKNKQYDQLIERILGTDQYIRSITIVDLDGTIIQKQTIQRANDFFTEEQNKEIMEFTLNYWNYRKNMIDKIGNANFILESYENFKKLVIALSQDRLLVVTFEKEGGKRGIVDQIQSIIDSPILDL